jgi:hypothetical protein
MVDMTRQGFRAKFLEEHEPKASVSRGILGIFCFDEPQRTAGHVGLGWEPMSQSAARLRLPA